MRCPSLRLRPYGKPPHTSGTEAHNPSPGGRFTVPPSTRSESPPCRRGTTAGLRHTSCIIDKRGHATSSVQRPSGQPAKPNAYAFG